MKLDDLTTAELNDVSGAVLAATLASTAPAFPGRPQEPGRPAGGRREMHAQLRRERQVAHGATSADLVRGPSVVAAPVRYAPVDPQHGGPQRDKVTHTGTQKKRSA